MQYIEEVGLFEIELQSSHIKGFGEKLMYDMLGHD